LIDTDIPPLIIQNVVTLLNRNKKNNVTPQQDMNYMISVPPDPIESTESLRDQVEEPEFIVEDVLAEEVSYPGSSNVVEYISQMKVGQLFDVEYASSESSDEGDIDGGLTQEEFQELVETPTFGELTQHEQLLVDVSCVSPEGAIVVMNTLKLSLHNLQQALWHSIEYKKYSATENLLTLWLEIEELIALESESAVHIAAKTGDIRLLDILLQAGASISKVDGMDNTPYQIATFHNHIEAAKWIAQHENRTLVRTKPNIDINIETLSPKDLMDLSPSDKKILQPIIKEIADVRQQNQELRDALDGVLDKLDSLALLDDLPEYSSLSPRSQFRFRRSKTSSPSDAITAATKGIIDRSTAL
jgi:hypothetical protein